LVLNNEWVSHPTWASEEAGFMSHRKNINKDALHTCEQEQHKFDIFIQANACTIAVLKPIWDQIQEIINDEKAAFRLPHYLGGPTKSIYVRIIKRIYGRTQWAEVWDALQNAPAAAVAVVLDRLHRKTKLDHMGNNEHKNMEKKNITAKYLVANIENKRKV
jgi:paired amphipathic helix protein Sin3a